MQVLECRGPITTFGEILSTALKIAGKSVTIKTRKAQNQSYGRWVDFCHSLGCQAWTKTPTQIPVAHPIHRTDKTEHPFIQNG